MQNKSEEIDDCNGEYCGTRLAEFVETLEEKNIGKMSLEVHFFTASDMALLARASRWVPEMSFRNCIFSKVPMTFSPRLMHLTLVTDFQNPNLNVKLAHVEAYLASPLCRLKSLKISTICPFWDQFPSRYSSLETLIFYFNPFTFRYRFSTFHLQKPPTVHFASQFPFCRLVSFVPLNAPSDLTIDFHLENLGPKLFIFFMPTKK
jgi:hypothetical protein